MNKTLISVLALALGACAPTFNGPEQALTVADRYPITVNEDTATLAINPSGTSGRRSDYDRRVIADFVSEYKQRGRGPIVLSSTAGTDTRTASDARSALMAAGVSSGNIQSTSLATAGAPSAPVVLSFSRYVASVLECGDWSTNMGQSSRNMPWPHFGCATENNLAAMVVDPGDFVEPRGVGPADADRRAVILEKYRRGDVTSATRSNEESGAVSEAVSE